MQKSTSILYFETEGRENLPQVLRVVKRQLAKRSDLKSLSLVVLTANGEGPALAYARLNEFSPRIIAVTFPVDFSVTRGEAVVYPHIPDRLKLFFAGVGVTVLTSRLPFDSMVNARSYNADMQLIKDVLTVFGGGFALCVQAVLSACDHGKVAVGEKVIAITGDTAAIITATTTQKFLSKTEGLAVNEIMCKPRNFTVSRVQAAAQLPGVNDRTMTDENKSNVIDMRVLPNAKPPKQT